MEALRLQQLLSDYRSSNSNVQMDQLITMRSGWTPWGMYKQALAEMEGRYKGLKSLYLELKKCDIDLREKRQEEHESQGGTKKERAALECKGILMRIEDLEREARDGTEEFLRFYAQADALKAHLGPFDEVRRQQMEDELRRELMKKHAAIEVMTTGKISGRTVDMMVAMASKRADLLEWVKDKPALIAYLENYELFEPKVTIPRLDSDQVKGLIEECQ